MFYREIYFHSQQQEHVFFSQLLSKQFQFNSTIWIKVRRGIAEMRSDKNYIIAGGRWLRGRLRECAVCSIYFGSVFRNTESQMKQKDNFKVFCRNVMNHVLQCLKNCNNRFLWPLGRQWKQVLYMSMSHKCQMVVVSFGLGTKLLG